MTLPLTTVYDPISPSATPSSMRSDQQVHTLLTAQRFGGNFFRKLAEAGLAADPINRATIFSAFPQLPQTFGPHSALYSEDLG